MIYWDYNATAPVRNSVKKRIQEAMDQYPGNPSSTHSLGQAARAYVERVRRKAAEKLGVQPGELIFTGSATETNLFAIRGYWLHNKKKGPKDFRPYVLASRIEHPSVCRNLDYLAENEGAKIMEMPRRPEGTVDLEGIEKLLKENKFWLCSLQGASNETGIIQPWAELAKLCQKYDVPMHSDMVQVFGRIPLSFKDRVLQSATISFHKSGGVRASSLLYLKQGAPWEPTLWGGAQEKKRWAGTENIISIASIDALIDEMEESIQTYQEKVSRVRDQFEKELQKQVPQVKIVGTDTTRLPNTSYCIFQGIASDAMLMNLDVHDICASAGSACSSGMALPSKTLQKLGYSEEDAKCAIRFSLGESSEELQIPKVLEVITSTIARLAA